MIMPCFIKIFKTIFLTEKNDHNVNELINF